MSFHASMLIYYLQSIARSLKLSSQQLRMQIQNASIIYLNSALILTNFSPGQIPAHSPA